MLRIQFACRMSHWGEMQSPHAKRMVADGIHWATQFELAQRGGITSNHRIEPADIEGYLQALRTQHTAEMKKMIDVSKNNVGRTNRSRQSSGISPPGLAHLSCEDQKARVRAEKDKPPIGRYPINQRNSSHQRATERSWASIRANGKK